MKNGVCKNNLTYAIFEFNYDNLFKKICKPDDKPGYVLSGHLSRSYVTIRLKQPT